MPSNSRLPQVSAGELIRALAKVGFHETRTAGSHVHLQKVGHRHIITVPHHAQSSIKSGTLMSILRCAGLSKEEFIALLDR
jgi:predicted RNA binding protein YcfA (HicA-like mRNA interferase family)